MRIDWKQVEAAPGLKGKVCRMAGISRSMWCLVKQHQRQFSEATELQLLLRLAIQCNYDERADLLREAERILTSFKAHLAHQYPYWEPTDEIPTSG